MKIKALVAVRAGSQRVKNKNIRPFANSTLLEIKLKQLLRCDRLDGVVVDSDDENMLKVASDLGCETVLRDPYYYLANLHKSNTSDISKGGVAA